jgi:hypothetical protein
MKEQIQKHARKHIKGGCYLKVTLGYRGLNVYIVFFLIYWINKETDILPYHIFVTF